MEHDVYQSPTSDSLLEIENLDPEGLRERYRRDEITVLAVGWFYYFFGALLAASGISLLTGYYWGGKMLFLLFAAMCLIVGLVYIVTGYGLRRFDQWARLPGMFAALVAIALPPAGLLAGVMSFFLLKRHAYKEMFTPRYQTAIISEGEINRHFGWLAIVGGGLSGLTLSLCIYLFSKGVL